jgi:hypothetical protein
MGSLDAAIVYLPHDAPPPSKVMMGQRITTVSHRGLPTMLTPVLTAITTQFSRL